MTIPIKQAIQRLAASKQEIYCKICTVDAIDDKARTIDCTPLDEGAPLLGVNLQANQNGEVGIVAFPRKDSHVVVAFLSDATAVVVLMDDVELIGLKIGEDNPVEGTVADGSVVLSIGDTSVELAPGKKITINGGELGGLVIIQELRDSLDSLKKYCETLNSATSAGLNAVGAALAANGALGKTAFDGAMASASIEIKNMENKDITH